MGFIKYSRYKDDIYKKIDGYNLGKRWKVLTVFDVIMDDMVSKKKWIRSPWTIDQR